MVWASKRAESKVWDADQLEDQNKELDVIARVQNLEGIVKRKKSTFLRLHT